MNHLDRSRSFAPAVDSPSMDEWGRFIVKSGETLSIKKEGVMEGLQKNNPAITSLQVEACSIIESDEPRIDWAAVGMCLGNNKYLKHLELIFRERLDSQDIQSFCGGLVLNKSLQSLSIDFDSYYIMDEQDADEELLPYFVNELFRNLFSLFKYNSSFVSIELRLDGYSYDSSIDDAIMACMTLRSIAIKVEEDNIEPLVQNLCRKRGLKHISIECPRLSEETCRHLNAMLVNDSCELNSLSLSKININEQAGAQIGNGLVQNKSLKCLKLDETPTAHLFNSLQQVQWKTVEKVELICSQVTLSPSLVFGLVHSKSLKCLKLDEIPPETILHLFNSLQQVQWKTVEKIDLICSQVTSFPSMVSFLRQTPALKSLTLKNMELGTLQWDTNSSSLASPHMLNELKIVNVIESEETLEELISFLANNNSLKVLDLKASFFSSQDWWRNFFSLTEVNRVNSIYLRGKVLIGDFMISEFTRWLPSHSIRALKIALHPYITSDSCRLLAAALDSHTGIEELDIWQKGGTRDGLEQNILMRHSSLKHLGLSISNTEQLQVILNYLERPSCQLEEIKIRYVPQQHVVRRWTYEESWHFTQIVAHALQRNSSLKILHFDHHSIMFQFIWNLFFDVLCNKSSITATYHSNHTLEAVNGEKLGDIPIELHSLLHLNATANTHAVAREKIIQNHEVQNVNFLPSSLPAALSFAGNAVTNLGLSQMYGILRGMPQIIQRASPAEGQRTHN